MSRRPTVNHVMRALQFLDETTPPAPDFTFNKPAIVASNLKLSASLISNVHRMDGTIANLHDDVERSKELDRKNRLLNDALNAARDASARRNGT